MRTFLLLSLLGAFAVLPLAGLAKIGVGVTTGRIQLEDPLRAGGVYDLPPLGVVNTGDVPTKYEVGIQYHANQPQIRPHASWFTFTPATFELAPGEAQSVRVQLTVPLKTEPGEYFAYVEGRPLQDAAGGGITSIGIAAAARLYFTIAPANIFQAIYYRTLYFWRNYAPWTYIAAALLVGAILLLLFRRFFALNIGLRKAPAREVYEEGDEEVIVIRRPKKSTTRKRSSTTAQKKKSKKE